MFHIHRSPLFPHPFITNGHRRSHTRWERKGGEKMEREKRNKRASVKGHLAAAAVSIRP